MSTRQPNQAYRDLVVAGARGVHLPADLHPELVNEPGLHVHVRIVLLRELRVPQVEIYVTARQGKRLASKSTRVLIFGAELGARVSMGLMVWTGLNRASAGAWRVVVGGAGGL